MNFTEQNKNNPDYEIVIFGASAGGPKAYKNILPLFPKDFQTSIILVQHMLVGPFIQGFVDGLSKLSINIQIPGDNEPILPNKIYVAPSGYQLIIRNKIMFLSTENNNYNFFPSIDPTFISGAKCYKNKTIGVILTGMSAFFDGVEGCRAVKENGGMTIAQSEETCSIFGMPKEAINAGFIDYIVDLDKIPQKIMSLTGYKK